MVNLKSERIEEVQTQLAPEQWEKQFELDAGEHEFNIGGPGDYSETVTVTVDEGNTRAVLLSLRQERQNKVLVTPKEIEP